MYQHDVWLIGMKHIIYTVEQGGDFLYTRGDNDINTIEVFSRMKKNGFIALKTGDVIPPKQKLYFIMLLNELDNYDFMLKGKR